MISKSRCGGPDRGDSEYGPVACFLNKAILCFRTGVGFSISAILATSSFSVPNEFFDKFVQCPCECFSLNHETSHPETSSLAVQ